MECQPDDPLQQQQPPVLATRPQRSEAGECEPDAPQRCAALPHLDHMLNWALLRSNCESMHFPAHGLHMQLRLLALTHGTSQCMQKKRQLFQIQWSALLLTGAQLQGGLQPHRQRWPPCCGTLQPALVGPHLSQMAPALQVPHLYPLRGRLLRPCIATSNVSAWQQSMAHL